MPNTTGAVMGADSQRMVWIDLEMTGLDVSKESIIEIATVITDSEFIEFNIKIINSLRTTVNNSFFIRKDVIRLMFAK